MEETRQKILSILAKKIGRPVQPGDSFATLQIDSLSMAELAYEIEQSFGVQTDEGVLDCDTVEDFIQYVISLQGA